MKKYRFCIVLVLYSLCNVSVKSQDTLTQDDLIALSQNLVTKAVKIFYQELEDFDRECFLLGTMDDNMGHYQTFTANKSFNDIDDNVKWMFKEDAEFLQEMGCEQVAYIDKFPWGHQIFCTFSLEVDKIHRIKNKVQRELDSGLIAF